MEYELVNVRRHPHPLLYDREGGCNESMCCRCCLPLLNTPSFRCSESDCDYNIHESCIHLPPQINSSLHPHHLLSLTSSEAHCYACGMMSLDEVYKCNECRFEIDIKCAVADIKLRKTSNDKYVHISHQQHPLTLSLSTQQSTVGGGEIKKKPVDCFVCELPIQSGSSTYFCSQCDVGNFHKECAELELQIQISDHPHPLYLKSTIFSTLVNLFGKIFDMRYKKFCFGCRNLTKAFTYSCVKCKFDLHVPCLRSLNHTHNFTRLQHKMKFRCGICNEKYNWNKFVYLCEICHILVDEDCVEFPLTLRIYDHQHHDLTYFKYIFLLLDPDDENEIGCKICGKVVDKLYGGYGCSECNYFTHLKCAQGQSVQLQSTSSQDDNNIHPHTLTVFAPKEISRVEYRVCDGCMTLLSNSNSSYGCVQCDFYIHEACAKLKTQIRSPIHPLHFLTLISIPNFLFQCEACLQHFNGFAYHCETCLFTFDLRCASIKTRLPHPNHQHPLFLTKKSAFCLDECNACGKRLFNTKLAFQCVETCCKFNLHIRCATLPVIVRYRFDQHPLRLTFFEKENTVEYYCDICEEERMLGVWFYSCQKCSFEAHQTCVLGEYPFVKSAMHKFHKHPLNLGTVMKNQDINKDCGACNNKLNDDDFAFECGACKFNVHATGPCYELQLSKRKLVYTNYNVFSRANQPEHLSIQPFIVTVVGPFSSYFDQKVRAWEENVFSSIRRFVVYNNAYHIVCIQIQYPENEGLVWSLEHGTEQGTRHEVCFDYPDEYLVSIRGSLKEYGGITSLTLETNRKTYGPFGYADANFDSEFSSVKEGVKIIGIFGANYKDTGYLASIGFKGISTTND